VATAKVLISGQGQPIKDRVSKLVRCSGCEFLHENGNCLKVGGFYSSVNDKDCPIKQTLKQKGE